MARSKQTSLKREKEKTKQKKRREKEARRAERLSHSKKGQGLDSLVEREMVIEIPARVESVPATPKEIIASQGRVSYYNEQKGYGFIKDNVTKGTVFFNTSSLPTSVKVNDILVYNVVKGPKGATADQILKVA